MTFEFFSPRISLLALAIIQAEGSLSVNARGYRNNNPGNLNFPKFPTFFEGYRKLLEHLHENREMKLADFIAKRSPDSRYLEVVCSITGFSPNDQIDVS